VSLFLAVVSAILLGSSDFFAARSARTTPSITVTRSAVLTSVTLSPLLLLVVDSRWSWRDSVVGALSGVAMIVGLMLLYEGYKVARMGIVAPLSSVLLTAVPVLWDAATGVRPGPLATVGMVVGIAALVLTGYTPGGEGSAVLGAVLGLGSGVAFGVAFTLMGQASGEAGLTPVITQRGAGLALLLVVGLWRDEPLVASGIGRTRAILAGLLGLVAIAALQIAFREGDLGPASVASSQFATVGVLLSVAFNGERMRWWQATGVGATAIAVSLIAVG